MEGEATNFSCVTHVHPLLWCFINVSSQLSFKYACLGGRLPLFHEMPSDTIVLYK